MKRNQIMNVLLITQSDGESPPVRVALIPEEELKAYDLRNMHNREVQADDTSDKIRNQICELFWRLGLVESEDQQYGRLTDPNATHEDLGHYIDPPMPITTPIVSVLIIRWAV
jgi:hypothetical protein